MREVNCDESGKIRRFDKIALKHGSAMLRSGHAYDCNRELRTAATHSAHKPSGDALAIPNAIP